MRPHSEAWGSASKRKELSHEARFHSLAQHLIRECKNKSQSVTGKSGPALAGCHVPLHHTGSGPMYNVDQLNPEPGLGETIDC